LSKIGRRPILSKLDRRARQRPSSNRTREACRPERARSIFEIPPPPAFASDDASARLRRDSRKEAAPLPRGFG
jgi:hypothetical protein